MNTRKSNKLQKGAVLLIILLGLVCYFTVQPVNDTVNEIFRRFATGDFEVVRDFVASYGSRAMFVSFLLMILTVVFPPLPAD
jgi:uncharacterized membrane protein YdjX (TVP38/TMEM64 family)